MQTTLLEIGQSQDILWQRAAWRECIVYGEHGEDTEIDERTGRITCFNCGAGI